MDGIVEVDSSCVPMPPCFDPSSSWIWRGCFKYPHAHHPKGRPSTLASMFAFRSVSLLPLSPSSLALHKSSTSVCRWSCAAKHLPRWKACACCLAAFHCGLPRIAPQVERQLHCGRAASCEASHSAKVTKGLDGCSALGPLARCSLARCNHGSQSPGRQTRICSLHNITARSATTAIIIQGTLSLYNSLQSLV
ncbi:hypothetical protein IE81DRAFT_93478 [Ceraceosorus guamensis]|uniref:Uncharacterized protein n=1 Tax=Ceraceosorus guamensis TaxID=1522189 RepID=A0A316W0J5_9BASI|nr:hypothetical protein IE81DRAFT_93478 [Ceraceosorus guamensis]PWN43262.1 hypothetical protein IE81DRAFT_93478 [Ceraceosorus guamensis]